jgi:hypothetical protein
VSFIGNLVAESLREGADLALPMAVRRVRRVHAGDAGVGQPAVWTFLEVVVAAGDVDRFAQLVSAAIEAGPWYCDLASGDETVVVFAGRVFRYPRADTAGRDEAEEHARAVGVPEAQIDWPA